MNFLLAFRTDGKTFGEEIVLQALKEMPGVKNIEQKNAAGAVLVCEYDFGGDSTLIRLKDNLETISISGSGLASLSAAFELQQRISVPMRLVDSDYSFDLELSAIQSLQDLRRFCSTLG